MTKRTTITLDDETAIILDALVNRLSHRLGRVSQSLVIRQALRNEAEAQGLRQPSAAEPRRGEQAREG